MNIDIPSKKLAVLRVLRDHPNLRRIENRQLVWKYAKQYRSDLTWPHVDRLCRYIQNTKKMYLPQETDPREEISEEWRLYFKNDK